MISSTLPKEHMLKIYKKIFNVHWVHLENTSYGDSDEIVKYGYSTGWSMKNRGTKYPDTYRFQPLYVRWILGQNAHKFEMKIRPVIRKRSITETMFFGLFVKKRVSYSIDEQATIEKIKVKINESRELLK